MSYLYMGGRRVSRGLFLAACCLLCVFLMMPFLVSCRAKESNLQLPVPKRYAYMHILISQDNHARPDIRTLTIRDGEKWRVEFGDLSESRTKVFLSEVVKDGEDPVVRSEMADQAKFIENIFAAAQDPDYMPFLGEVLSKGRKVLKFRLADGEIIFIDKEFSTLVRWESDKWLEIYTPQDLSDAQWANAFTDTNSWMNAMASDLDIVH